MADNVVSGLHLQELLGSLSKFGEAVDQVLVYVVANKVGPAVVVLMQDVLLQRQQVINLLYVRQVVLAVTQDVIHAEDFLVTYVGQADSVCVYPAERKRLLNVFGVKDVLTQDVNNLIAVV